MIRHNTFNRSGKTAFKLSKGEAIFPGSVYLVNPYYIRKNSPAYSLVANGKHITGLFHACQGFLTGDYKGQSIVGLLSEMELNLWLVPMEPNKCREELCRGRLSDSLTQARAK